MNRDMGERTSIELKGELPELEKLPRIVADIGERYRLRPEIVFHLNLVLEEILSNVMTNGYDDAEEHKIRLGLWVQAGELTLEVEDDGAPFNPLDAAPPDLQTPLEDRRIGGLGIHLVRSLTDRMEYQRKDGRNCLTLKKNVK